MTITTKIKTITLTLGAAAATLSLAAAPQASAGVVGCKASGSKQEIGAVVGGLLGAVAGNKIAGKGDRGTGTAIGAVVGAGAGSAVGCGIQKSDEDGHPLDRQPARRAQRREAGFGQLGHDLPGPGPHR
jgi:hypothetical protein